MDIEELIRGGFRDSAELKQRETSRLAPGLAHAAECMARALSEGGQILACGNGGSAGDAQHLAAELVGRFEQERPGMPAVSLCTDPSTVTSISNDYGYDELFARQVRALGRPGDVLVAITTSGNSPNVVRAAGAAHERQMAVIALTGKDGGALAKALSGDDIEIRVSADRTPRIQEVHLLAIHCLCEAIDTLLPPAA